MGRQSKIQLHELEEFVLGERARGRTTKQIAAAVNDELAHRNIDDSVDKQGRAVERYLQSLDEHTVPAAHQPQVAEQNAAMVFDIAGRLGLLDGYLVRWIEQADLGVRPVQGVVYDLIGERVVTADALGAQSSDDPEHEDKPVVQVYEVDWQARRAAAGELRQACVAIADLVGRIHDAEQVRAFQASVSEAIAEASPEVAAAVLVKLKAKQSIVRASLLGAAA